MSKHLDFTRITPDVAVWCKTEEEDIAFRQACEERGILWADRTRPTKYTSFGERNGDKLNIEGKVLYYNPSGATPIPYSDLLVEDKPAKSRMAEILGVEDDEEWEYDTFTHRIHDGRRQYWRTEGRWEDDEAEEELWHLIAHPESIIRKPRFTPDELAMLRCFASAGIVKMKRNSNGVLLFECGYFGGQMDPNNLLPSIRPGESVELAEVLK